MTETEFLGEIRLSRGLGPLRATTVGTGLAVATGLILLYGFVVGQAGPAATLSYFLGGLTILLTLANYVEVLLASPEPGGSYVLGREVVSGLPTFLIGWIGLTGGLMLSAVLANSFAAHAALFLQGAGIRLPIVPLAPGIVLVLAGARLLRLGRVGRLEDLIIAGVMVALAVGTFLPQAPVSSDHFSPFAPGGLLGVSRGMALVALMFVGFEAIALFSPQMQEPRQVIPRTFARVLGLSTGFCLIFSLVAIGAAGGMLPQGPGLALNEIGGTLWGEGGRRAIHVAALLLTAYSLNLALRFVVSQALIMGWGRLLPRFLGPTRARLTASQVVWIIAALVVAALAVQGLTGLLVETAAFCFLLLMTAVDLVAALAHRFEDSFVRTFELPFFPLIPIAAITANLFLIVSLPPRSLTSGLGLIGLGLLAYFAYARARQIEAREGIVVFKSSRKDRLPKAGYRVLVPIGPDDDHADFTAGRRNRRTLVQLATAIARHHNGEVVALQIVRVPDHLALDEGRRIARERNVLFEWSLNTAEAAGVTIHPITRIANTTSQGILDTAVEEDCDLILMGWRGGSPAGAGRLGTTLDPVIRDAPCDIAVVRWQDLAAMQHILVPTAGGPHAPLAVELGLILVQEHGGTVTVLNIVRSPASAEDMAQGRAWIDSTLAQLNGHLVPRKSPPPTEAGPPPTSPLDLVERKVIIAPTVMEGLLSEAEDYDLVLLGASDESLLDQVLFGNFPERIARECSRPVIMVKRYSGLTQFWLRRLWRGIYAVFPSLDMAERVEVYKILYRGAHPDVDFFVMIVLSCFIATMGLLLSSGAVIIGAMLVAPLMMPILALALGIVQGDARLLHLSVEATLKGIVAAIAVALFLTILSPLKETTPEILARARPSLLDLVVALASGAAGGYALGRKEVAAALPGVAIAAALIPPLCTVGVGIATGQSRIAGGALLLFSTNLIAISLAAAVIFLLLGFRPTPRERERWLRLRQGLLVAVILLLAIAIPMGIMMGHSVAEQRQQYLLQRALEQEINALPGGSLRDFTYTDADPLRIEVTLYAVQLDEGRAEQLAQRLTETLGRPIKIRFRVIPVIEVEPP